MPNPIELAWSRLGAWLRPEVRVIEEARFVETGGYQVVKARYERVWRWQLVPAPRHRVPPSFDPDLSLVTYLEEDQVRRLKESDAG